MHVQVIHELAFILHYYTPLSFAKGKRSKLKALIYLFPTSNKQPPQPPAQLMKYHTLAPLKSCCDQYALKAACTANPAPLKDELLNGRLSKGNVLLSENQLHNNQEAQ